MTEATGFEARTIHRVRSGITNSSVGSGRTSGRNRAWRADDIAALLETRVILEMETARLAAERAAKTERDAIDKAQQAFRARAESGDPALQEDLTLHLAIAQAAHNAVLASLVGHKTTVALVEAPTRRTTTNRERNR